MKIINENITVEVIKEMGEKIDLKNNPEKFVFVGSYETDEE